MPTLTAPDGTTLTYDRTGEGPPVVLVTGALTDRATLVPLADALADRFTVVNYDRRGRSDSGNTEPYAIEREIEDLQAVIDLAGQGVSVFANCTGAMLALEAAAQGVAMERLALYEPPYMVGECALRLDPTYRARMAELVRDGLRGDAVEYFMRRAVGFPAEAIPKIRASGIWPSLEALAPSLVYDAAIAGDNSLPVARLAGLRIPTLVMYGGESPEWQRHAVRVLADTLPVSTCRCLEGRRHNLEADAVAPPIREFFSHQALSAH